MVSKPSKPSNNIIMPRKFGGDKNNFSTELQNEGYKTQEKQKLHGDNLNYMLNAIGQELEYLRTVVDYLVDIPNNQLPYISGNQLTTTNINNLLSVSNETSGKFLTNNGTNLSWSSNLHEIGDPIFTLNFNKILSSDYIWLDGRELNINEYEELYKIYGYTYSSWSSGNTFKVPSFNNCTIWGGTTAGKVDAGLPNITGTHAVGSGSTATGAFYVSGTQRGEKGGEGGTDHTAHFDASRSSNIYGKSNTVQPPAIKVRAYTRAK